MTLISADDADNTKSKLHTLQYTLKDRRISQISM